MISSLLEWERIDLVAFRVTPLSPPPWRLLVLVVSFSVLLTSTTPGCTPPKVDLSPKPKSYKPHQYEDVWEKWTRVDKAYEDIIVNVEIAATYWSHDFCYAYAAKWADIFGMGKDHAKEFLEKLLKKTTKHHEFFFAVVTQEQAWNSFADKKTNWRLALVTDKGVEVEPSDIKSINPITATHKTLFPQIKLFYSAYHVRFPRKVDGSPVIDPDAKYFALRVAGPKGKLSLRWTLKR
jgi:hypothetical protein